MLRNCLFIVFLVTISTAAFAAEKVEPPTEATTTEEILKAAETSKGFGKISKAEFDHHGEQTFVVWYCPYSGRDSCHVYAYTFDNKAEKWVRFLGKIFDHTHDITVESPASGAGIVIRSTKRAVIYPEEKPKP